MKNRNDPPEGGGGFYPLGVFLFSKIGSSKDAEPRILEGEPSRFGPGPDFWLSCTFPRQTSYTTKHTETPKGTGLSEEAPWKQVMIRNRPRWIYHQAFPHVLANRFGSLCLHIVYAYRPFQVSALPVRNEPDRLEESRAGCYGPREVD